jgi:oligosaccharide repeat unit polymerase
MASLWLPIVVSITILLVALLVAGPKDPLFVVCLFYFYFAFGPVFNFILGNEIYSGTLQKHIPEATWIFTLGLAGFLVAILISKPIDYSYPTQVADSSPRYFVLNPILIISILFQLGIMIYWGPRLIGMDKNSMINTTGLWWHYNFLLLQHFLAVFFLLTKERHITRKLLVINFALFLVYCLLFSERDFVLILVSLAVYYNFLQPSKSGELRYMMRLVVLLMVGAALATWLAYERMGSSNYNYGIILNQGNLLFVNTQIIDRVTDHSVALQHGATFVNSFLNLLPRQIYSTKFYLLDWFKDIYAPLGPSGYGFALDAETFLNFSYPGIPVVFFVLGIIMRWVSAKARKNPFFLYLSVNYMIFLMSALRNDSLSLMKGTLYAIVFFVVVIIASRPAMKAHLASQPKIPFHLDGHERISEK